MFAFDPSLAQALWRASRNPALSRGQRGDILERLAEYILVSQEAFSVRRRLRVLDGELDLLARNFHPSDQLMEILGPYVLVECKNWHRRVKAATVKTFVANLKSASCNTGLLVSLKGVTGVARNRDGMHAIRKFYHRDNIVVMTMNQDDIEAIVSGRQRVRDVFQRLYEQIRFEIP